MSQPAPLTFFEHPILNSPYAYPGRHWELDADGQPTSKLIESGPTRWEVRRRRRQT